MLTMIFVACSVYGKTTYIPVYRTFIQIKSGNDSISLLSKRTMAEITSNDEIVRIYVQHEEVTKEKVKAIKRAKMAAGFAEVSAVLSSISATISAGSADLQNRVFNAEYDKLLSEIYHKNAIAEQILDVYVWIDNVSNQEIMINDLERGLTWYILPKQSMRFKVNNPDFMNLRISNIDSQNLAVKYVKVGVGSLAEKTEIGYEDEFIWVTKSMQDISTPNGNLPMMMFYITKKDTFETEIINGKKYRDYVEQSKRRK